MVEILLYSGGMDSYIAWHFLSYPPTMFVRLGHRYEKMEFDAAYNTIPETFFTKRYPLGEFEQPDAYIPMRNLLLAMVAVGRGADKVWLVVQKDEMSIADRSEEFFDSVSKFLSFLVGRQVEVDTPFRSMDKTDMVRWYVENGKDVAELKRTIGCYNPTWGHCGDCPACFRRFVAFKNNGLDPGYELTKRIRTYYHEHLMQYGEERQERMKPWL